MLGKCPDLTGRDNASALCMLKASQLFIRCYAE
jgi:hypothetical protein